MAARSSTSLCGGMVYSRVELGRPYGPTRWPNPPEHPPETPPHLGPVLLSEETLPEKEPHPPMPGRPAPEHEQALRSVIAVWSNNRRLYPGWLVAPERFRQRLLQSVRSWEPEFSRLQTLSPFEQLTALGELAWRMERALLPLPAAREEAAFKALATVDRDARTVDGVPILQMSEWTETIIRANTLTLALARNARHAGNRARFDRALGL